MYMHVLYTSFQEWTQYYNHSSLFRLKQVEDESFGNGVAKTAQRIIYMVIWPWIWKHIMTHLHRYTLHDLLYTVFGVLLWDIRQGCQRSRGQRQRYRWSKFYFDFPATMALINSQCRFESTEFYTRRQRSYEIPLCAILHWCGGMCMESCTIMHYVYTLNVVIHIM